MRDRAVWMLLSVAMLAASATDARAQMSMETFKGYLTGHVGQITSGDVTNERLTFGGSVAVHDGTGWGAELDLGHTADVTSGRQLLDVTTYLVNAAWVKPAGIVRPFALLGAGVMQVSGCDVPCTIAAKTYDFGLNVGGGTFLAVNDAVAFRADARYIFSTADHRDIGRPDNFTFWRVSAGITYMWSAAP
jgi:opacity protein-like surface antigen